MFLAGKNEIILKKILVIHYYFVPLHPLFEAVSLFNQLIINQNK